MSATNEEIISFINDMSNRVIREANRRIAKDGRYILPSVVMAQSAHETGWGLSSQMTKANAYFGIKPGSSWKGRTFSADTWEVYDGVPTNVTSLFRAYDSLDDSVADYFDLILNNSRYANAISRYPDDIKSAYDTLYSIWSGGYATDEEYVPNVWNLLQGRDLTQFDSKVDGVTFDPNYSWEGGTGGDSGGSGDSGGPDGTLGDTIPISISFEKIEDKVIEGEPLLKFIRIKKES